MVYNFNVSDDISEIIEDLAFQMNLVQERERFLDQAFQDRNGIADENDDLNQECLRNSILEEMRRENLHEQVEENVNSQESHGLPSQGSVFAAL